MKILLINPPVKRPLPSILPSAVEESRGLYPPLGLLYLAGAVNDLPGVKVSVLDADAEGFDHREVGRLAHDGNFDLVGITAMSFFMPDVLETANEIKRSHPGVTLIAGGPHPHLFPEETLALGPFDAVLRGEGEQSFRRLILEWDEARRTPPPGVWWKDGPRGNPDAAPLIGDLDSLAFPERRLGRIGLYHSVLSPLAPVTTMMSSRGCPHACIFCDRPHLGKKFRARSAENVAAEMAECRDMGIKEIIFYDDTFSLDKKRVRRIAELLIERDISLAWDIRARVSDLDTDDLILCRRAGLRRVHFGVESGNPEILASLKKGITLDQARAAFNAARHAGLETLAYFMVGLPGETRDTASQTLDFARELAPDYVHFSALIPFPGTPLYQMGLDRCVIPRDVWREFAANPTPDFQPPLWTENLSADEIRSILAGMYKGFYRQPRVLWRRLKKVRSLTAFNRHLAMGLKVLFMRDK